MPKTATAPAPTFVRVSNDPAVLAAKQAERATIERMRVAEARQAELSQELPDSATIDEKLTHAEARRAEVPGLAREIHLLESHKDQCRKAIDRAEMDAQSRNVPAAKEELALSYQRAQQLYEELLDLRIDIDEIQARHRDRECCGQANPPGPPIPFRRELESILARIEGRDI